MPKKSNSGDANGSSKPRRAARKVSGCFKCSYCPKTFTTPQGRGGHCGLVHKQEMDDFNREFQATINGELELSLAPPNPKLVRPVRVNIDLNLPVVDDDGDNVKI